jgi:hypothetical protein
MKRKRQPNIEVYQKQKFFTIHANLPIRKPSIIVAKSVNINKVVGIDTKPVPKM